MTKLRRVFYVAALALFVVIGFQTASHAVLAFLDGDSYGSSSKDYKLGYAAGSLDMLRALQDAGKLQPISFDNQAKAIMDCYAKKLDTDIDQAYVSYLRKYPAKHDRSAASAIYNAMREACGIS
jgi:predicted glycosyltransferase involved in capsule biosynthesis